MPRHTITTQQRALLRDHARQNPHLKQTQLRQWFIHTFEHRVSQSTISESLSARYADLDSGNDQIYYETRKKREKTLPELEEILFNWIRSAEHSEDIPDADIAEKARSIWVSTESDAEVPPFSRGWLHGFKKRHGLTTKKRKDDNMQVSPPTDTPISEGAIDGSLDPVEHAPNSLVRPSPPTSRPLDINRFDSVAKAQLETAKSRVQLYAPMDVYNCDETRLYWKYTPDSADPSNISEDGRENKARFTALFCCNADGSDKLQPLFVGYAAKPRSFEAAKTNPRALDCVWKANSDASVTTPIMTEWLLAFDDHMGQKNKKALLLLDELTAHKDAVSLLSGSTPLRNIEICFLPTISSKKLQPLQSGVVSAFKGHYRKLWLQYMVDEYDEGRSPLRSMNVLKAVRWSIQAWGNISPETIINCWRDVNLSILPAARPKEPSPAAAIANLVLQLAAQGRLQPVVAIERFINPDEEELVEKPNISLIERLAAQYADQGRAREKHTCESDEDYEDLPLIRNKDAIGLIDSLVTYEEQQEDGSHSVIRVLNQLRERVQQRSREQPKPREHTNVFFAAGM
ncbi:hypothetical protein OXX59_005062 [Metschnikowia pulcherrima]